MACWSCLPLIIFLILLHTLDVFFLPYLLFSHSTMLSVLFPQAHQQEQYRLQQDCHVRLASLLQRVLLLLMDL